ncbi:MAG: valine--tRNA ligase, partial [Rhodospirillales bacterium]
VYIHALVRDEKGQKMSKSKGNIIDPLDLIEKYGCDALRFTLCALAAQGRDIKLAESRVEGYRNFATKLWNAARFCEMNECKPRVGFDPWRAELTLNRWILAKTAEAGDKVAQAVEAYRFNDAANAAYAFVWNSFCDWYLEFAKPIFNGSDEAAKAETRATTAWVLDQILHLLHPFMPFVTEELWEKMSQTREGRLIGARWPTHESALAAPEAEAEMDWVVRLISSIRSVRSEMNVPPGAKLSLRLKGASAVTKARLDIHLPLILTLARLDSATASDEDAPKGSVQVVVDEATAILPLAGHVDVAKEKARLEKEIARLADDIGKTEKKLSNPAFVERADPDVVVETRERLSDLAAAKGKLSEALERLKEM